MNTNNIPQGIIDELNMHYNGVVFDLDSTITDSTQSLKLRYKDIQPNLIETSLMDPFTFEVGPVVGYPTTAYLVRLDETTDNGCIVRRLVSIDIITKPDK